VRVYWRSSMEAAQIACCFLSLVERDFQNYRRAVAVGVYVPAAESVGVCGCVGEAVGVGIVAVADVVGVAV
jgi:hypothetical protein